VEHPGLTSTEQIRRTSRRVVTGRVALEKILWVAACEDAFKEKKFSICLVAPWCRYANCFSIVA
jgi:hypothetical protein